uniref:STI1 domain-containing protein n=1 Tax=Helicotheca tamesis TaxID=374047 RepID=A0A7S2HQK7_9STRA|mmetsp:Transcript_20083/g.27537  ORF Transcript_20083/g.27537 Transcript_20083/m.27537 type:complete len:270 (+) Transcript_20083:185-994(+)|eukprot:CAMPEP_0185728942 /NCGR_PEP_ID=MMETSP1171-20130828/4373_1 /TAXON_ID=374046 /ORGANISM="Helicotheca tamensis, Strain CCMP826" /LENGTH=269 /DNA_ID=CAMNT_0028397699 /DNA_START=145 /DNA_END=954 /DNA_ORIENTATION=-
MARGMLRLIGVASLLASPCVAQFGVPQKKKGTTFQEVNEMAKDQMNKGEFNMDAFANMDMGQMQEMMAEALKDPEMMKYMEDLSASAMKELDNLTPEKIMEQMEQITSGDMIEKTLGQKDEVLKTLEATGMVPPEDLARYKADPEAFEKDIKDAFNQMNDLFTNPDMVNSVMDMMKGFGNVMKNPDAALEELAKVMQGELDDDAKIEEARLQLLSNPELAGSPALASIFNSEEMKEVLNDPEKWKQSVKEGQGMLLGRAGGSGAEVGEL